MRYYSPAELSRMKTEKDTKATQEIQLRRRQEEARATIRAGLTPVGVIFAISVDWLIIILPLQHRLNNSP